MPGIDEDIMRELMHRCTDDLHAPPHVAAAIVRRQRHRRLRHRALGVAVAGAAAGTAFAVVASAPGTARPGQNSGPAAAGSTAIRLTAAQKSLYQLSDAAARTGRPGGRYVILAEKQDNYERTSVVDSLTGDVWTYQHGAGVPSELPVARHDSPTAAQFDAMPTDVATLRALLIKQGKKHQATTLLWNPLAGPQLRAALYKVLADTPGVKVDNHARDGLGRAAVEISRTATSTGIEDQTFENPRTGAVLETAFGYQDGTRGTDLYMPVTSSNHVPPNPYQS
jgi:hypothetical protein